MQNCYLLKRCQDLNFFLRSKQLASDEICRAIILVIEFPDLLFTQSEMERVNVDISKMLK